MGSRGPTPKSKTDTGPQFRPGLPPPPPYLTPDAAEIYTAKARELKAAGAGAQSDDETLAQYAQDMADVIRLSAEIRKEGEIITGHNGIRYANPKAAMKRAAQKAAQSAADRLGFSPAARARVPRSSTPAKTRNPFAEFIK